MKRGNIHRCLVAAAYIMAAVILVFLYQDDTYHNQNVYGKQVFPLPDWQTASRERDLSLPDAFYDFEALPAFIMSRKLDIDADFAVPPTLLLSAKYCDMEVFLDGAPIFVSRLPQGGISRSMGAQYLLVPLPKDWRGRTLSVRYMPLLGDAMKYGISVPLLGESAIILRHQLLKDLPGLVAELILMVLGVVLVFLDWLVKKRDGRSIHIFSLGLFSLSCGIYLFCQMTSIHILIGKPYLLYFLEFSSLATLVLEIAMVVRANVSGLLRRVYDKIVFIFLLNILAIWILNFVFHIDFRRTLLLTHAMITVLVCCILLAFFRKEDMPSGVRRELVMSIIPVVISGVTDTVLFYVFVLDTSTAFFKVGLFSFISLQAFFHYKRYLKTYQERIETRALEDLAYHDALTGLLNRLAYHRDLQEILERCVAKVACISLDLNDLKRTNDSEGHAAGDQLIQNMAELLSAAVGKDGHIYRVGGDEFIVLAQGDIADRIESLEERILAEQTRQNGTVDRGLSFALGSARYEPADGASLEKMAARADAAMYSMKRRQKAQKSAGTCV